MIGVVACLVVMSQVEAVTFLRAGALLLLGLLLWALERGVAARGRPRSA